jgi:hypothetical protein
VELRLNSGSIWGIIIKGYNNMLEKMHNNNNNNNKNPVSQVHSYLPE